MPIYSLVKLRPCVYINLQPHFGYNSYQDILLIPLSSAICNLTVRFVYIHRCNRRSNDEKSCFSMRIDDSS